MNLNNYYNLDKKELQKILKHACLNGAIDVFEKLTSDNRLLRNNFLPNSLLEDILFSNSPNKHIMAGLLIENPNFHLKIENIKWIESSYTTFPNGNLEKIEMDKNYLLGKVRNIFLKDCDTSNFTQELWDTPIELISKSQEDFFRYCKEGDLNGVIYLLNDPLLSNFVNPSIRDDSDSTGLLIAAKNGNLNIIQYLLTSTDLIKNSDINEENHLNLNNAVMTACYNRELETIKYLLESPELKQHVDINKQDLHFGYNALMLACNHGSVDLVKYFTSEYKYKEKLDLYAEDRYGNTALYIACQNLLGAEHKEIVKFLIVDIEIKVDDKTKLFLEENHFSDILDIINKKDLYNNLSQNIKNLRVNEKDKSFIFLKT